MVRNPIVLAKLNFCAIFHPTPFSISLQNEKCFMLEEPNPFLLEIVFQHAIRRRVTVDEGLDVDKHFLAHGDTALGCR